MECVALQQSVRKQRDEKDHRPTSDSLKPRVAANHEDPPPNIPEASLRPLLFPTCAQVKSGKKQSIAAHQATGKCARLRCLSEF